LCFYAECYDFRMSEQRKMAVILIAPPGAGKGTQADLLAERYGLVHLETSKIIQEKFRTANPDDSIIIREKARWAAGELNSQALVATWLLEAVHNQASAGSGIVFSGSPRNLDEVEAEMPVLEELYDKANIKVFNIKLSAAESVKRNSGRRVCEANRHPIPNFPEYAGLTACPQDGSPLVTRDLDKPELIEERYRVYLRDTAPVLAHLAEHGYQAIEINGEQPIDKVFADINQYLQ